MLYMLYMRVCLSRDVFFLRSLTRRRQDTQAEARGHVFSDKNNTSPMENKRSRSVFVLGERGHGFISGCLPCAPLCYLASGGSKISTKTRSLGSALLSCLWRVKDLKKNTSLENKTRIYSNTSISYISYIFYSIHILYAMQRIA